jgi:hypothetical protein
MVLMSENNVTLLLLKNGEAPVHVCLEPRLLAYVNEGAVTDVGRA